MSSFSFSLKKACAAAIGFISKNHYLDDTPGRFACQTHEIGFVFSGSPRRCFVIISFQIRPYTNLLPPQIGFVFSSTLSICFGFRYSDLGFPAEGRLIGFVFSNMLILNKYVLSVVEGSVNQKSKPQIPMAQVNAD
jgi:hypothetical protein